MAPIRHFRADAAPFTLTLGMMRVIFWFSLMLIGYAYVGYALWLMLLAKWQPRPVLSGPLKPTVSVIIAAHNEASSLPGKLQNLFTLDYPPELLQIVVASDGSTDGTPTLLDQFGSRIVPVVLPVAGGKAVAVNHAVAAAQGEILVFMDARQRIDSNAVSELVSCFADPTVGAVSGELHLETAEGLPSPDGLGVYWKLEKLVRRLESATGSVVGVTGALFAMRHTLYVPLPVGTLLDDVLTPMQVARSGHRVLFLDKAIARDRVFAKGGKEFGRKVRTLTGNYQLLQLAPWLLSPANPLLFRLISHKLLRLVVPFLLVALLITSGISSGRLYHLAFGLQLMLYGLALLGVLLPQTRRFKAISVAYTFSMLNVAAAMALYNLVVGRARWA